MPDVSVVIPTRDRLAVLQRTVTSVLAQTLPDLEILVVVDGAVDGTLEAMRTHPDARVRVVHHATAQGVSAARNAGVAAARADWIAFLDDDDLWAPDKLRRQHDAAQASAAQWAFSASVSFTDDDGEIVSAGAPPAPDEVVAQLPFRNCVPAGASNVLVHHALLRDAGPFDTTLRHMADWDLWIRLAQRGVPAVVDAPDVAYRLHERNASSDSDIIEHELTRMTARHSAARGGAPIDRAFAERWVAWNLLRAGQRGAAVRHYGRAVADGDLRSVLRAVAAAADPHVVRRAMGRACDAAYVARASDWLQHALRPDVA